MDNKLESKITTNLPVWVVEKMEYDKRTGAAVKVLGYEINEASWRNVYEDIKQTLSLVKKGEQYSYKKSTGEYRLVNADVDSLAELLQREYEDLLTFSIFNNQMWYKIAKNIKPFIEEVGANYKYITFRNKTIDVEASFAAKSIVFSPSRVEVADEIDFDLKDIAECSKTSISLMNKIMKNYTKGLDQQEKDAWILKLLTMSAYLLSPINDLDKILIFKSQPGTGKSVWLSIMIQIFGPHLSSGYNPLMADEFAETGIYGKRFIYNDDLKKGKWHRQEKIQSISSAMPTTIRMSGGRNVTWHNPNPKILFLTNYEMDASNEAGIWDRIDVLEFKNQIRNTEYQDETIKHSIKSKDFVEYAISLIINFGFKNLVENGLKQNKEYVKSLKESNNYVKNFRDAYVSRSEEVKKLWSEEDRFVKPMKMFEMYKTWMKVNGDSFKALPRKEFDKQFESFITKDSHSKVRKVKGTSVVCYDLSKEPEWNPTAEWELEDL